MFIKTLYFTFHYYLMGIANTLLTSLVIILVKLLVWNAPVRKKLIFHKLIPGWAKRMVQHTGSEVNLEGADRIDFNQHYLVLANHQSNFDIYLILGYLQLPIVFISKRFYFKIPFIGGLMREMGCIEIHRSSPSSSLKSLAMGAKSYEQGNSIVIYPEGTRSRDGVIQPFKRGYLHLVERVGTDTHILPITLSGAKNIQTKGTFRIKPSKVKIHVAQPIIVPPNSLAEVEDKDKLHDQIEGVIKSSYQKNI